jgi:hypothetical protein
MHSTAIRKVCFTSMWSSESSDNWPCSFLCPGKRDFAGPILTAKLHTVGECSIGSHHGCPVAAHHWCVSFPAVVPRSLTQSHWVGWMVETTQQPAVCGLLTAVSPIWDPDPTHANLNPLGPEQYADSGTRALHDYGCSTHSYGHGFSSLNVHLRRSRQKRKPPYCATHLVIPCVYFGQMTDLVLP